MECRLLAIALMGLLLTVASCASNPSQHSTRSTPSSTAEPAAYQAPGTLNEPGDLDDSMITPEDIEAAGPSTSESAVPAGGHVPPGGH